jgi:hypothetical protein
MCNETKNKKLYACKYRFMADLLEGKKTLNGKVKILAKLNLKTAEKNEFKKIKNI